MPRIGIGSAGRIWRPMGLLVIAGALIVPLIYATWFAFELHRERVDHGFQVERDQIASVLVNGMVEPVWNLAPEWGRPLVESTMRNANVLGISVTSLAQGDFLELRRDGAVTAELTPIVVSRHIVRDGSIIGEIAVAFDSVVVQEARRHQRGLALSVLSLQVALSLGLVYLVFLVSGRLERHRVLRHVNATLREGQERFHDMASNVPGIVYQFRPYPVKTGSA